MKKNQILSLLKLVATPVMIILLGLILVIHPDSASALASKIIGWVLIAGGICFGVAAVAGPGGMVGKVLSAVACFVLGIWLLKNPLLLASGIGRLVGIIMAVRGVRDILDGGKTNLLSAIITIALGVVLIALPMTTSRVVLTLCGILVMVVGIGMLADRLKTRRLNPPDDDNIIDAL